MVREISPGEGIMPTFPPGDKGPTEQDRKDMLSLKEAIDNARDTAKRFRPTPTLNQLITELDPIEKKIDGMLDGSIPWSLSEFIGIKLDTSGLFNLIMQEQQKQIGGMH